MGPTGLLILASVLFSVERWMRAGGYFVLFGLLFACGLGLPLPEDIPLTIGGFLVAKGQLHIIYTCIAGWCGIIGGDLLLYHFGKRYGLNITKVPFIGKHVTEQRIRQAEVLFDRYGIWVVAVGRMLAGIRGAMVIAAGAIRFNLLKFIIADGLAAIVSGGLFIALGHWVGVHLGSIDQLQKFRKEKISGVEHWVILGVLVAVVGAFIYAWWRRRTREKPSEVLLARTVERVIHKHHDPTQSPKP